MEIGAHKFKHPIAYYLKKHLDFQPMAAQLLMKAALQLAKSLVTTPCGCSTIEPYLTLYYDSWG